MHCALYQTRNFRKYINKRFPLKFNYSKYQNDSNLKVKHNLRTFGIIGISAFLISSYFFVKKSLFPNVIQNNKQVDTIKHKLNPVSRNPMPTKLAQEDDDKISYREKFNFINKVVGKCAASVFYLEISDPSKADPETGGAIITSNGSGFMISEDGWALTNAHVVLNKASSTIKAIFRDGKEYIVRVEDIDINMDLALLKIETTDAFNCLKFEESGDTLIGEWVVALGSPLSLSNSVTVGIVSSVSRSAEDLGLRNYSMTYIQTDASITFGNSGGPLVNLDGNVIGINNLRLTSGISFAIPIEYAKKFLSTTKFQKTHEQQRCLTGKPLFGMTTISINNEVINDLLRDHKEVPNDVTQGLLVWKVLKGSPAYTSGLQVGDIITHVNGIPVKEASELYSLSRQQSCFKIEVVHEGKKKTILVQTDD